ncbi:hypothetical protein [Chryseobacterium sp. A301]
MKRLIYSLLFTLLAPVMALACEACDLQQPAITKNLTHGSGPQGTMDWIIVAVISLITLATLFYSAKYLIVPGEKSSSHIKKNVLNY